VLMLNVRCWLPTDEAPDEGEHADCG